MATATGSGKSKTRTIFKWTGFGCGGVLVLFVLLVVIAAIIDSATDGDPNEDMPSGSIGAVTRPAPTPSPDAGSIPTAMPEPALFTEPSPSPVANPPEIPTPTPTLVPTSTPEPTPTHTPAPTPTLQPIRFEIAGLLGEYEKNKVLANTKYRYLENGKQEVTVSGIVTEVDELYVNVGQERGAWFADTVKCYYSDTRAALLLAKDQEVTVTGRIRGEEYGAIVMFRCRVAEVQLEKIPTARPNQVRNNVMRVSCIPPSSVESFLLGSRLYQGTGVILDKETGVILTAHHVVEDDNGCSRVEVSPATSAVQIVATVAKHCASIDRAILQIPPNHPALSESVRIYPSTAPAQEDQEVYFWGYGTNSSRMERGIVESGSFFTGGDVTMTAHAVRGDSGSPVFDESGRLLGIMTRSNRSDVASFNGGQCP